VESSFFGNTALPPRTAVALMVSRRFQNGTGQRFHFLAERSNQLVSGLEPVSLGVLESSRL
jgi:hypothetical protein